jgi:hypothetical protein
MLTPTIILAIVRSIVKNIAKKPGEENNSSKVVGGIQ